MRYNWKKRKKDAQFYVIVVGVVFVWMCIMILCGLLTIIAAMISLITLPVLFFEKYQLHMKIRRHKIECHMIALLQEAYMRKNFSDGWMTWYEIFCVMQEKMMCQKMLFFVECAIVLRSFVTKHIVTRRVVSTDFIAHDFRTYHYKAAYRLRERNFMPKNPVIERTIVSKM